MPLWYLYTQPASYKDYGGHACTMEPFAIRLQLWSLEKFRSVRCSKKNSNIDEEREAWGQSRYIWAEATSVYTTFALICTLHHPKPMQFLTCLNTFSHAFLSIMPLSGFLKVHCSSCCMIISTRCSNVVVKQFHCTALVYCATDIVQALNYTSWILNVG